MAYFCFKFFDFRNTRGQQVFEGLVLHAVISCVYFLRSNTSQEVCHVPGIVGRVYVLARIQAALFTMNGGLSEGKAVEDFKE